MAGTNFYSIDTSALIHWWDEAYSPEQVPGLVPLLESLVEEGQGPQDLHEGGLVFVAYVYVVLGY